jgi:hypothetical protein
MKLREVFLLVIQVIIIALFTNGPANYLVIPFARIFVACLLTPFAHCESSTEALHKILVKAIRPLQNERGGASPKGNVVNSIVHLATQYYVQVCYDTSS